MILNDLDENSDWGGLDFSRAVKLQCVLYSLFRGSSHPKPQPSCLASNDVIVR